eukprot:m.75799 g.75799  ORF g.75799 m.75799 type:complete len:277 (+) comp11855_c0_seq1:290-1120(+)
MLDNFHSPSPLREESLQQQQHHEVIKAHSVAMRRLFDEDITTAKKNPQIRKARKSFGRSSSLRLNLGRKRSSTDNSNKVLTTTTCSTNKDDEEMTMMDSGEDNNDVFTIDSRRRESFRSVKSCSASRACSPSLLERRQSRKDRHMASSSLSLSSPISPLSLSISCSSDCDSEEDLRKENWNESALDSLFVAGMTMGMDEAARIYDPFRRCTNANCRSNQQQQDDDNTSDCNNCDCGGEEKEKHFEDDQNDNHNIRGRRRSMSEPQHFNSGMFSANN